MSNDITALMANIKAAAEKATPGEWWIDSHGMAMVAHHNENTMIIFVTDGEQMGEAIRHEDTGNLSHWRNDNDATFIAIANPTNVLALVEALEMAQRQIQAHERAELTWMNALALPDDASRIDILPAIHAEKYALREATKRISSLESRTVNSEKLQESSYRAGLTTGWNLGLENNNVAFNKCLASHSTAGIAELESRTVTVKLPPRVDSSNVPFTAHTWNCCLDEVEKCLTAAGIQVIEGEGQ